MRVQGLRWYTSRMKILLVIIVSGAGIWFLMARAKRNAAVQQAAQAPERYVNSLQNDVSRAKAAEETANKLIKQQSQDVQKAVDAAQ